MYKSDDSHRLSKYVYMQRVGTETFGVVKKSSDMSIYRGRRPWNNQDREAVVAIMYFL